MTTNTSAQAGERAGSREWIGLGVLALPTLLLSLDLSVLYLALPHLSADLKPSSTQMLWIADIYNFMIAGFMIMMGSLGDRIGRRKLLLFGAAAFAAASVLAAYSVNPAMLIASRAAMGIAGSTLQPSALALISNMFRNSKQRTVAISLWSSCFMVGLALGPLMGGLLLDHFWWGSVFLLAVPVMVLLLVAAPFFLPEYRDAKAGRLDPVSVVLSLATILPVVYGLTQVAAEGLTWPTGLAMAAGLAIGVVFVRRQRHLAGPMFDLGLLANRGVSGSLGVLLLGGAAISGILLFFTQYLQLSRGLPPLRAGQLIIPYTIGTIGGSLASPAIARRIRPGVVVAGGLVISALGFVLVSQVTSGSLLLTEIGLVIACGGISPIYVLGTDLIVGSVPPERAGSAASLSMTSSEVGVAVGVAAFGSIGAAVYRHQIAGAIPRNVPPSVAQPVRNTMADAVAAIGRLPGTLRAGLLHSARDAFTSAFSTVATTAAILVILLAILAAATLVWRTPASPPEPGTGNTGDTSKTGKTKQYAHDNR